MKSRFLLRLTIKLAALALYIMLLFDFGTGRFFHMIAGTAVCVLTVTGLLLDRHNLRAMHSRSRNCTISTADSVLLSTETLVAVEMVVMLLSGVVNRMEIPNVILRMTVYGLHVAVAYLLPTTMAVRIALQFIQWRRAKTAG